MNKLDYFIPGHQFFIAQLDGMSFPSVGYCSHYENFEVFVVDLFRYKKGQEKILVEIIGKISDPINN